MGEVTYEDEERTEENKAVSQFFTTIKDSFHTTFCVLSGIVTVIVSIIVIIAWRRGDETKNNPEELDAGKENDRRLGGGELANKNEESEENLPWLLQNESSDSTTSSLCKENSNGDNKEVETLPVGNNDGMRDSDTC